MKPLVSLRPVTPADENFLYRVYSSTREQEMAMVPWDDAQREAFLKMQFTAQQQDYRTRFPDARHSIIVAENVDVGRIYLDELDGEFKILDVTILPEHKNRGIGTFVVNEVCASAGMANKCVTIYVESFNPSMEFFNRRGFEKVAESGFHVQLRWRPAG